MGHTTSLPAFKQMSVTKLIDMKENINNTKFSKSVKHRSLVK